MEKKSKIFIGVVILLIIAIIAGLIILGIFKKDESIPEERVPSIADMGEEVLLSEIEQKKVEEIIKYANFFYTQEFNQGNLSDVIMANLGYSLSEKFLDSNVIPRDDFDNAIYNYFGRNLAKPEELDTGLIKYAEGVYQIAPMSTGDEGIYEHKYVKAYDLKDGYIKIECTVDYKYYDLELAEDVLTENAGTAQFILKKNDDSSFGYNVIAYLLDVQ